MTARISVYAYTQDLERMRRFYEGGLALKPASQQGNWLPFELGGATFALHGMRETTPEVSQRFNLTFVVDDIHTVVARFEAHGAKVLRGVADEAFGKRAFVEDPEGRAFEIVQEETA